MIWTTTAKKLLEELGASDSVITLDSLAVQVGETVLDGRGTLKREKGRFFLIARFGLGSIPTAFSQTHFDGMQKPRLYSRDDFWKMEARTSSGVSFACNIGPPHRWTNRGDGFTEIHCLIDKINLSPKALDATDLPSLEALLKEFKDPDVGETNADRTSLDPLVPVNSEFHAILPGVKCLLAEHITRIERHNAYLPPMTSEKLDTFVDENADRTIALIEADGDLHVYLNLAPSNRTEDAEDSIFSALLDAVAFTHGCQPYPRLKECSRGGRVACCEIRPVAALESATIKPLREHSAFIISGARSMLGVAFDFFASGEAIALRFRKVLWLYRDAATKAVPLPVQVLTACTLFEGLVKSLFDAHGLKAPTKNGQDAVIFRGNKEAAKALLMVKHRETGIEDGSESDWSRMAGYLNDCDYVRPKERLKALADYFGMPWENDVEEIHKIWNRHRNGLAHGAELKSDFASVSELFQGWSRLSGAIHRFILAEMGYVGRFTYSPMELGLEELLISQRSKS